jgi:GntR family transcriptional regulator
MHLASDSVRAAKDVRRGEQMTITDRIQETLVRLADDLRGRGVSKLPPERDLATRLGTSRSTVRKALDALEADGVIRRVKGRSGGAYLADVPARTGFESPLGRRLSRDLNTVQGVPEMLHAQGFEEGTRVLSAELAHPTPQIREILHIPHGSQIVSLLRVRYADGDTLSLERMYLRASHRILDCDLHSIYATLHGRFGVKITTTLETIEIANTTESTASLLDQPAHTGLLRLERIGYDQANTPVEYSIDLFRADRTRLQVRTAAS